MNVKHFDNLTDTEIIAFFRDASLESAKCGFNTVKANRIIDDKITPTYEAIKARGHEALQEFLELADDPDPNVRVDAVTYAYDADPARCRQVLKSLLGEPGMPGIWAVVWLIDKDSEFEAEFGQMCRHGLGSFLNEFDRRYPPKKSGENS